jgi:hypothetical protein
MGGVGRPLVTRFVLVLVVVLVLESLRWGVGVMEYCALPELQPASAGLGLLSGHVYK